MTVDGENPRLILGLKLRSLRRERGMTLREVAAGAGLSVSYLSEIEKGKKYPQPEKLVRLAETFELPFDELVSLRVEESLGPLKAAVTSPFVREFPFELFGFEAGDLWRLLAGDPIKAGALAQTFLEVGRTYDVRVEHFLLAALRSYQKLRGNYFPDLEESARAFREERGWSPSAPIAPEELARYLEDTWDYRIDYERLPEDPNLRHFRSVYRRGDRPTLYVNGRLLPSQRAFVLGREIGYRHLGLVERALSSSWLKVESFEQVLNNFRASYFSGALLLDRETLARDLEAFFARPSFDGAEVLRLMALYDATPETFFTRWSQLVGELFGLDEIYYMRFTGPAGRETFWLTKVLNMSGVPVPHGTGLGEHYCRRWPAIRLLGETGERQGRPARPLVSVQRSHFLAADAEFLEIATRRRLALSDRVRSSVALGFRINSRLRQAVAFWADPQIPRADVNSTCERCGLAPADCADRAAPPSLHDQSAGQAQRERALERLVADG